MSINNKKTVIFTEDTFDLEAYKEATNAKIREKARIKRIRRNITLGKIMLTISAFSISILIYYILSVMLELF